ncbi:MAG: reverse transcriptase domain-containing protein, partial [Bacteroidota bacterium]|nr:reverse transcriptase domain-containing protein [Bacteroidota bacterium]
VLDLWFEKAIKPRLKGECYLIRYIDDFIVCFQYKEDAVRFREVLEKRLAKFALELEPNKTRLVEFGRFASEGTKEKGRKVKTIYFLGFTLYCTRNRNGKFMVGRKTEKTRLRRSIKNITEKIKEIRHWKIIDQVKKINEILRGHYNYYGLGGNLSSLLKVYRRTERMWVKMLSSRSWRGRVKWEKYHEIKKSYPILRPKLHIPYEKMGQYAML